uniref:Uncharacterized protein n=1 Tax=Cannabis sativa TaxID=3483 RepID=A0A803NMP8_CANSA
MMVQLTRFFAGEKETTETITASNEIYPLAFLRDGSPCSALPKVTPALKHSLQMAPKKYQQMKVMPEKIKSLGQMLAMVRMKSLTLSTQEVSYEKKTAERKRITDQIPKPFLNRPNPLTHYPYSAHITKIPNLINQAYGPALWDPVVGSEIQSLLTSCWRQQADAVVVGAQVLSIASHVWDPGWTPNINFSSSGILVFLLRHQRLKKHEGISRQPTRKQGRRDFVRVAGAQVSRSAFGYDEEGKTPTARWLFDRGRKACSQEFLPWPSLHNNFWVTRYIKWNRTNLTTNFIFLIGFGKLVDDKGGCLFMGTVRQMGHKEITTEYECGLDYCYIFFSSKMVTQHICGIEPIIDNFLFSFWLYDDNGDLPATENIETNHPACNFKHWCDGYYPFSDDV